MPMRLNPWFLLLLFMGAGGGGGGPTPTPKPKPKPKPKVPVGPIGSLGGTPRPPGDPLGLDCGSGAYNQGYWPSKVSVKNTFAMLGYPVPEDRETMNKLGPDNMLGGGDDLPNAWVQQFQSDYNAMSSKQLLGGQGGGLDEDGMVGPCTLNGLENVLNFYTGDTWPEAVGAVVQTGG